MHRVGKLTSLTVHLTAVCLLVVAATACRKSEPVYSGISIMGQNYLPYNLDRFTITDAYGNKASGGGDEPPGAGGGSLTCCYKLKGTEFTVKWDYYDVDQWHTGDESMFHAEAAVSLPPSTVPGKIGTRIFEVHFFPDHHVELQFPGGLLDDSRLPIVEVTKGMGRFQEQLNKRYDERDDQQFRRIARVVAAAWLKYRMTDQGDLQQYAYFGLLVNDRFDSQPEVQRILQATRGQPGAFAKAIQSLPANVMTELTTNHFASVPVPAIPDGLLPPPRREEEKNG
jgi:hypothetical protein